MMLWVAALSKLLLWIRGRSVLKQVLGSVSKAVVCCDQCCESEAAVVLAVQRVAAKMQYCVVQQLK